MESELKKWLRPPLLETETKSRDSITGDSNMSEYNHQFAEHGVFGVLCIHQHEIKCVLFDVVVFPVAAFVLLRDLSRKCISLTFMQSTLELCAPAPDFCYSMLVAEFATVIADFLCCEQRKTIVTIRYIYISWPANAMTCVCVLLEARFDITASRNALPLPRFSMHCHICLILFGYLILKPLILIWPRNSRLTVVS